MIRRALALLLLPTLLVVGGPVLPAEAACKSYVTIRTSYVSVQDLDGELNKDLDRIQLRIWTCGSRVQKVRVVAWGSPAMGGKFDCGLLDGIYVDLTSVGGKNFPRFWLNCQSGGMGRTLYVDRTSSDQCVSGDVKWVRHRARDLGPSWSYNAKQVCG